jgi:CBS domain-containing protein
MIEIQEIMETSVITVTKDTPIYDAIGIMVANNITGLPVVDDDMNLAGIISEKDVLDLLYNFRDKPGTVADFMTADVVSFTIHDSLTDVAASFRDNFFRRVPIVSDGKLVGIISRRDIIKYIARQRKEEKSSAL